jgi:DNA modification methylase
MGAGMNGEPEPLGTAFAWQDNALTLRSMADETVDLIITSPPYFALRSYEDDGQHYEGQIGSEPSPAEFLESLWKAMEQCWRVLKPSGSVFVNLGDKMTGSGGHNNAGVSGSMKGSTLQGGKKGMEAKRSADRSRRATRRNAPDRYNQSSNMGFQAVDGRTARYPGLRRKTLMGLPWRFVIGLIDGSGAPEGESWILRSEIVWDKPNGLPESVRDRVRRSHEQWFHLVKSETYFAAIDAIREPYAEKTWTTVNSTHDHESARHDSGHAGHRKNAWARDKGLTRGDTMNPLGRLPGSVWRIAAEPLKIPTHRIVIGGQVIEEFTSYEKAEKWLRKHGCRFGRPSLRLMNLPDHFAAFPSEWPRRLILAWCPPDGVVLDPFGGSGTVAMTAKALGRHGLSVDLSASYCRLAKWRINNKKQIDRIRERTWATKKNMAQQAAVTP